MRRLAAIALSSLALAGCAGLARMDQEINNSVNESFGYYSAPILGTLGKPGGCSDRRCQALEQTEFQALDLARSKRIRWIDMVNAFYKRRAEIYPNSNDAAGGINELIAYQRLIAEQMDLGRATEVQWNYLVERKLSEIRSRTR